MKLYKRVNGKVVRTKQPKPDCRPLKNEVEQLVDFPDEVHMERPHKAENGFKTTIRVVGA